MPQDLVYPCLKEKFREFKPICERTQLSRFLALQANVLLIIAKGAISFNKAEF